MKIKLQNLTSSVAICLTIASLVGCAKKPVDAAAAADAGSTAPSTPTDGSQSKAQLAGYGYTCQVLTSSAGSSLNGKAFERYLKLYADGTYDFATDLTEGNACAYGHSSGPSYGTVDAQYNVQGTYTVGGTAGTPSDATKITFTPTTVYFTVYDPQLHAAALDIANWANSNCGAWGASFLTTGSSTRTFTPLACTSSASVSMGTPPAANAAQTNIILRASSAFQSGALQDLWSPGAGSFPSSYTVTWQ